MKIQKSLSVRKRANFGIVELFPYFVASFCVIVLFSGSPSYGITTLRFGVFAPQDHPWTEGVKDLKKEVELTSKDQIKIEIVPWTEIGSSKALLSKVRGAIIHLGLVSAYSLGETVDAMRIFRLPFAFRDKIQAKIATSGVTAKELLNELAADGLVGLDFVPSEHSVIVNTNQPIITPGDFKGLQIATQPDPTIVATFKALGAGAISIPSGQMYYALSKGTVSAAEGLPSFFYEAKWYEVAKFITVLPIRYFPGIIVANPETWMGIPSHQRNLLKKAIPPIVEAIDSKVDQRIESAIKGMRETGMGVYYPGDISPFRKAVSNVYMDEAQKISAKYWQVAYNCAYVKRDLEVCSRPDGATVFYRRHGDKQYNKYHALTDTSINIEYAVWKIRAELLNHIPQEKEFNPYVTRKWRVDFELRRK